MYSTGGSEGAVKRAGMKNISCVGCRVARIAGGSEGTVKRAGMKNISCVGCHVARIARRKERHSL
jgi:hypothetical protein